MATRVERPALRTRLSRSFRSPERRLVQNRILIWVFLTLAAICLGALLTGSLPLPGILLLPPAAILALILLAASLPALLTRWKLALSFFFLWLMFEDLVRKLSGNNLGVYFVKDVIYFVVLIAVFADPQARGAFREATGRTRLALGLLIAWAVVMSVPSAFRDWRLPLIGLSLDFLFAPLVIAGYLIGRKMLSLRMVLLGLSLVGAVACGIGIVQAAVGPTFLAPSTPTPGLNNLVTIRNVNSPTPLYRPTGPFVDPGRFADVASATLAVSLAAGVLFRGWRKAIPLGFAAVAGAAIWVSGGRAQFITGCILVLVAAVAPAYAYRRPALHRAVPVAVLTFVLILGLSIAVPDLFAGRLNWYKQTLSPGSTHNEWRGRWFNFGGDALRGIQYGGLIGLGTGKAGLGTQYIFGGSDYSTSGLGTVESGYGGVAYEWGVIGLILWLVWSISWVVRQFRCVQESRDGPIAAAGLILAGWVFLHLFVHFFAGLQLFQDYVTNAIFWLVSGMLFALPLAARAEKSQSESESE